MKATISTLPQPGVTVKWQQGPGEEWREIRQRISGEVICRCRARLDLTQETVQWVEARKRFWQHSSYGPGSGDCKACDLAYCDDPWSGLLTFDLGASPTDEQILFGDPLAEMPSGVIHQPINEPVAGEHEPASTSTALAEAQTSLVEHEQAQEVPSDKS